MGSDLGFRSDTGVTHTDTDMDMVTGTGIPRTIHMATTTTVTARDAWSMWRPGITGTGIMADALTIGIAIGGKVTRDFDRMSWLEESTPTQFTYR